MADINSTKKLQRKITLYAALGLLFVGAIVALVSVVPFYFTLKEHNIKDHLFYMLSDKTGDVKQCLIKARDTALQIANRTWLRDTLEAYNNNMVDLQGLVEFTKPGLLDVVRYSDDVEGIGRYDRQGNLLLEVGMPVPEEYSVLSEGKIREAVIHGPLKIDNSPYFLVKSPIFNRKQEFLGTDLILLNISHFQKMLGSRKGLGQSGEIILTMFDGQKINFIPVTHYESNSESGLSDYSSLVPSIKSASGKKEPVLISGETSGGKEIVAYLPVDGSNLGVMLKIHKSDLFLPQNTQIYIIAVIIVVLILFGTIGIYLLLKPLSGKVLIQTEELEREVVEKENIERKLRENLLQQFKSTQYEEIVSTITKSVHSSINLQEVLDRAVQVVEENIDQVKSVGIWLTEGNEALLKAHVGVVEWASKKLSRIPNPNGFVWRTIIDGNSIYCADTEFDQIIGPIGKDMGIKSYLSVPIKTGGESIGVMAITSEQAKAFDNEELNLLKVVVQQIEVAINNAKQAEALRASEERYRTLFDQSPVGIYIYDRAFIITQCNDRMAQILGSTHSNIEGLDQTKLIDQGFMDSMKKVFSGDFIYEERFYEVTTSNTKLWLSVTLCPLLDRDGNVESAMGVIEDITQRKLAEEELRESEERIKNQNILLEKAVDEKQHEMELLMERMIRQEKLAAIGQVSGSIAHELRNPLGAIKQSVFYLNRLQNKNTLDSLNPKVKEHLELINNEINTSEHVISDLLQMTRMRSLSREEINLPEVLNEAKDLCTVLGESSVDIDIDGVEDSFIVWADPVQFRQVLVNLITNAVQSIDSDGVVRIEAEYDEKAGTLIIYIQDEGCGMNDESLQRAFEPLYTTKSKGTGLGLSICKQIIENHGGNLNLCSKISEGTKVTIELPVKEML